MAEPSVLLVDDEAEFASTLAERLNLRGFEVRVANGGEEALRCISEEVPQVIILDVKMPGLSGMEVLKRVRADHPQVPVILLTGLSSTKEGIEGMQLGAFDYLMKPLEIEDLIAKIREAVI
jgi:DNA-binding response OmpR family regulator